MKYKSKTEQQQVIQASDDLAVDVMAIVEGKPRRPIPEVPVVDAPDLFSSNFPRENSALSGPAPAALAAYIQPITANWRKIPEAIIEVGKHCARAQDNLTPEQLRDLVSYLPFKSATMSKLASIGRDSRRLEQIMHLLAGHWTTMYEIRKFNDEELNAAVREGIIWPGVERDEIIAWKKKREAEPTHAALDIPEASRTSAEMELKSPETDGQQRGDQTTRCSEVAPAAPKVSEELPPPSVNVDESPTEVIQGENAKRDRRDRATVLPPDYFAGIRVPASISEEDRNSFRALLLELCAEVGASVVFSGEQP